MGLICVLCQLPVFASEEGICQKCGCTTSMVAQWIPQLIAQSREAVIMQVALCLQWTQCRRAWLRPSPTDAPWCPCTAGYPAWPSPPACPAWSVVRRGAWTCLTPSPCLPPPRPRCPACPCPTPPQRPRSPPWPSRSTATVLTCTTDRRSAGTAPRGPNTSPFSPSPVAPLPTCTPWASTTGELWCWFTWLQW